MRQATRLVSRLVSRFQMGNREENSSQGLVGGREGQDVGDWSAGQKEW